MLWATAIKLFIRIWRDGWFETLFQFWPQSHNVGLSQPMCKQIYLHWNNPNECSKLRARFSFSPVSNGDSSSTLEQCAYVSSQQPIDKNISHVNKNFHRKITIFVFGIFIWGELNSARNYCIIFRVEMHFTPFAVLCVPFIDIMTL